VNASADYDLLVVGGGINGVGIARDAAGRGLRVLLCEQDDLAAHTSSASTKLIHGGLRYLEYGEFRLVRKALLEREVLLRAAPQIVRPLRFVMPHMPHLRPAWLIRAGLFLYDHLAPRKLLHGSSDVNLRRHVAGAPLLGSIARGFVYSDGWVDDARLVVLNALDAQLRGATILTRTRLAAARRDGRIWHAELAAVGAAQPALRPHVTENVAEHVTGHITEHVTARAIVNAAGPWVAEVLDTALQLGTQHRLRLVKGSHIVVKRLFDHDYAYIFQNPDKRIIFAIPYERDFTLIGTTDVEFRGDAAQVRIDDDEIEYLCTSANRYFKQRIAPADVVWTYSGVRPLLENDASAGASALTRDYRLDLDLRDGAAPLLSVFGGKITTFRKLAEEALERLATPLGITEPGWTASAPLPGGDIANANFESFADQFQLRHRWLPADLARRYARAYGTRAELVLDGAQTVAGLGAALAPGLYEAELRYLRDHEWARTAIDVLWRRSKLGLHVPPGTDVKVDAWLMQYPGHERGDATAARDAPHADWAAGSARQLAHR